MRAELLTPARAELGEGPVWRHETSEVIWVDILQGHISTTTLNGDTQKVRRHSMPVGAIALTESGEILSSTPVGLVDSHGAIRSPLPPAGSDIRANDGKPDPAGRFVSGTMSVGDPRAGAGSLWSMQAGSVDKLVDSATIANGLAWSPNHDTLFWIDTPLGRVDAFDYDLATGQVSNRRVHVEINPEWGSPDGMCIDIEGRLWVALWGGSAVRCFDGATCVEIIELPTPLVTCPTFAGPALDQLVITTASIGDTDPAPEAGALYCVNPGTSGEHPHRLGAWAG